MIREPACSGRGHFTFAALILGIGRVSHPDRTDQPNEMRGAEDATDEAGGVAAALSAGPVFDDLRVQAERLT